MKTPSYLSLSNDVFWGENVDTGKALRRTWWKYSNAATWFSFSHNNCKLRADNHLIQVRVEGENKVFVEMFVLWNNYAIYVT